VLYLCHGSRLERVRRGRSKQAEDSWGLGLVAMAFNVLLHVLLIGSLAIFTYAIIKAALSDADPTERWLRIAALFAGAMVTLGARAAGVNYATFTVNALAGARPASAAAHVAAAVIPAALGSALGFYIVRTIKRNQTRAIRIMGFIGMLAVTAFIQIYVAAASQQGLLLGPAAVPNVAFTAGVILTLVFTYDASPQAENRVGLGDAALSLARKWRDKPDAPAPGSSAAGFGSPAPAVKDPFDHT